MKEVHALDRRIFPSSKQEIKEQKTSLTFSVEETVQRGLYPSNNYRIFETL
jgi:hypothetical protein